MLCLEFCEETKWFNDTSLDCWQFFVRFWGTYKNKACKSKKLLWPLWITEVLLLSEKGKIKHLLGPFSTEANSKCETITKMGTDVEGLLSAVLVCPILTLKIYYNLKYLENKRISVSIFLWFIENPLSHFIQLKNSTILMLMLNLGNTFNISSNFWDAKISPVIR